jgi:serine/threonine protein kinase
LIEGLKPAPEDCVTLSAGPAGGLEMLGDYAILRELGRGAMGIVYEAERESLRSRVALKVMHLRFRADRAYLRRFQTEARSAAKLHHTNIVSVFDYGQQGGICYYAMQYIAGIGLERVLEDVRRLRDPPGGEPTAGTARGGGYRSGRGHALGRLLRPPDRTL